MRLDVGDPTAVGPNEYSPSHPAGPARRASVSLARAQADQVAAALATDGIESSFVGITTAGDVDQRHLTEIGGSGVFVSAVRDALRRGEIDVAVHSLKDLPTAPAEDLEIIAIPTREDTRDVLVGCRLDDLADGDADRDRRATTRDADLGLGGRPESQAGRRTDSGQRRDPDRASARRHGRRGDLGGRRVAPSRRTG